MISTGNYTMITCYSTFYLLPLSFILFPLLSFFHHSCLHLHQSEKTSLSAAFPFYRQKKKGKGETRDKGVGAARRLFCYTVSLLLTFECHAHSTYTFIYKEGARGGRMRLLSFPANNIRIRYNLISISEVPTRQRQGKLLFSF